MRMFTRWFVIGVPHRWLWQTVRYANLPPSSLGTMMRWNQMI